MNQQLTQFILESLEQGLINMERADLCLTDEKEARTYILERVKEGSLKSAEATQLLTPPQPVVTTPTLVEEVDYTRDIFIERNGVQVIIKPHQLTNEELVKLYYQDLARHYDSKTLRDYQNDMKCFIDWWQARYQDHAYWKMTYREAEAYVDYLQKELKKEDGSEYSVSAKNRRKSAVSTFYSFLDDRFSLLDNNKPYEKRNEIKNLPHLKDEKRKDRVLTFDECVKLMDTIATSRRGGRSDYTVIRNYTFYRLMLRLGTRIKETTLLEVSDFDFENRILHIRKEIAKFKKARDVMIPEDVMQNLKDFLQVREALGIDSEYMFPTGGGKSIDPKESNNTLKTYLKEAGIPCEGVENVTNHTFRHTHITHEVYATDRDSLDLCKQVGHANVQTLLERYLKATDLKALGGYKIVDGNYPY